MLSRLLILIFLCPLLIFVSCKKESRNAKKRGNEANVFTPPFPRKPSVDSEKISVELKRIINNRIYNFPPADVYPFIDFSDTVFNCYSEQAYIPIWFSEEDGFLKGEKFLAELKKERNEALSDNNIFIDWIDTYIHGINNRKYITPASYANLDIMLSSAFLQHASELFYGSLDPSSLKIKLFQDRKNMPFCEPLKSIAQTDSVISVIRQYKPDMIQYKLLKDELKLLLDIEKTITGPIEFKGVLSLGDSSFIISEIKRRIKILYGEGENWDPHLVFDDEFQQMVRFFRYKHGIPMADYIDEEFIRELNLPITEKIKILKVNLERLRWMNSTKGFDSGKPMVLVNIPDFRLQVIHHDSIIMSMKVITGQRMRKTPIFSDSIRYIVFAPYWHVPNSMAQQDILPKIKSDPDYLSKRNFEVWSGWGRDAFKLDPQSIYWEKITRNNFRYRFSQKPGPSNALGRVKFMFPNPYNVYLHDTPQRELFKKFRRDFSSGCIRVEAPFDLAVYLLPELHSDKIKKKMEGQNEETIHMKTAVQVHISYFTVWCDDDKNVIFRKDVYGIDKLVSL
jgi:L,D-transpeptidase YcbB